MLRFIESKARKLHRLIFCARKFGILNSARMNLLVGSTDFSRTLRLREPDGKPLRFTFRGRRDQGVLSHFYKEGFCLEETAARPVRTILDCGANIGDETARFRLHHPEAEIIAVEADAENCEVLRANCEGSPRTLAIHGAVWSHDTTLHLQKSDTGNPEASSVRESDAGEPVRAYSVRSLMALRGWTEIDILKLDVEGAEHAIFSGDTSWLERVNCLIFEVPDFDHPGTLQLIFEKLSGSRWNGASAGENLVLVREGLPWRTTRVEGVR